jgi:beta-fructofuranosidase
MRGIADPDSGWASAHSVPHVLTFEKDRLVATPHPDLEKYRTSAADGGELPGLSGDIIWSPSSAESLRVTSAGKTVFVLDANSQNLIAKTETETFEVPYLGGDVRIILDAQAIEVSSTWGILGFAAAPGGPTYRVDALHATVYPLDRQA